MLVNLEFYVPQQTWVAVKATVSRDKIVVGSSDQELGSVMKLAGSQEDPSVVVMVFKPVS